MDTDDTPSVIGLARKLDTLAAAVHALGGGNHRIEQVGRLCFCPPSGVTAWKAGKNNNKYHLPACNDLWGAYHEATGKGEMLVCPDCGCNRIHSMAWIDLNSKTILEEGAKVAKGMISNCWCPDCGERFDKPLTRQAYLEKEDGEDSQ